MAVDGSLPPDELARFRGSDWWAPELDPLPPPWVAYPSQGTQPHQSPTERAGMWAAINAFRRYQDAKATWEADHGKIDRQLPSAREFTDYTEGDPDE